MGSAIRQRYRRVFAVAVAVGLLSTGACSDEQPTRPATLTACELHHRSEVARVLGGPVAAPARAESATDTLAGRSGCAWSRSDDVRAVLIELVRTDDMAGAVRRTGFSAAARFGAVRSDHPDATAVDGLGDVALFVEEEGTLHVLAERSYLTFEVAANPTSAIRAAAEELARLAVGRLQSAERAD